MAFSWAASSLTVTAVASRAALPQSEDQRSVVAKQSKSEAEVKEKPTKKKIEDDPESESNAPLPRSISRPREGILARPETNLDQSCQTPLFGYAMARAFERYHGRAFRDGQRLQ